MAGPFTVDASVFLSAFNDRETGHAISRRFLEVMRVQAIPTLAPTLLLPEVSAGISRGRQDAVLAQTFTTTLTRFPLLMLIALDKLLADQAAAIAAEHRLRGSDAVYAAVARRFGTPLVSLDQEQLTRVTAVLTTITPQAALITLNA